MSRSCGRATAQSFAEFAQNLYMCTSKLKKIMYFLPFLHDFGVFLHFLCDFFGIFCAFSCAKFSKVKF